MKELSVPVNISSIPTAINFVNLYLESFKLHSIVPKVDIAIDEILSNISNHSLLSSKDSVTIYCHYNNLTKEFFLVFVDQGKAYNPTQEPAPDTTASIEKRSIGGMGWFIVKNIMDSIKYKRQEQKNILILKKFIDL